MRSSFICTVLAWFSLSNPCDSMTIGDAEVVALPDELKPISRGGSWFDDMAIERLQRKHQKLKDAGALATHHHEDDSEEMFIIAKLGKDPTQNHAHPHDAEHIHPPINDGSFPPASDKITPKIGASIVQSMNNQDSLKLLLKNHKKTNFQRDDPSVVDLSVDIHGHNIPESTKVELKKPNSSHPKKVTVDTIVNPVVLDRNQVETETKSSMTSDEFLNHYKKELNNFFRNFMTAILRAEMHEVRIEEKH